MTILNHAATGALAAAAIHNPWIGLPAAFCSHFVIDALPHWDFFSNNFRLKQLALMADVALSLFLLVTIAATIDASRRIVVAGGALGIAPDFMWAPYLITGKPSKTDKKTPLHLLRRFHFWIQLKELPRGIYFEAIWFVIMITLIYHIHR